jgi:hypothetical protein
MTYMLTTLVTHDHFPLGRHKRNDKFVCVTDGSATPKTHDMMDFSFMTHEVWDAARVDRHGVVNPLC